MDDRLSEIKERLTTLERAERNVAEHPFHDLAHRALAVETRRYTSADLAWAVAEVGRLRAVVRAATALRNQAAEGETWEVMADYAKQCNNDYMLRVSEAVRGFDAALKAAGMVGADNGKAL